jgi:hypothetical protein
MTLADLARDPVLVLDERLASLSQALAGRDANEVVNAAQALRAAVERAAQALREPNSMSPVLRRHLTIAVGQVAAQREAIARAAASVDRAIDVLLPGVAAAPAVYGANGQVQPRSEPRAHVSA